ncbi:winged helix-turn-helix domain-containing protein [Pontibacillus yanchengensis]|uniref:HTH arsR-type domain-containing protein n=1 Tax=Pontibacillus yanchengensis Y32 TaxID=1385514 RepID=A0A0A2T7R7_9BACI|nr:helix-turn-helix domain-containing protein [Pontibacillus yanchengensis]KGP71579.1 hypothetical protein N782_18220 [Pontibacillus yanchengensis Y32]
MENKKIAELGKLLFDTKTIRILETIKDQALTTKEIAASLNEKTSNLYYPIKKLHEAELIFVEKEERVKNIIEKRYRSSTSMEEDTLSIEGDFLKNNYEDLVKWVMLEVNKSLSNLAEDVSNDSEYGTAEFSMVEKKLSYENWKQLNEYIREYIDNHEEDDEDGNVYKFFISSYKE